MGEQTGVARSLLPPVVNEPSPPISTYLYYNAEGRPYSVNIDGVLEGAPKLSKFQTVNDYDYLTLGNRTRLVHFGAQAYSYRTNGGTAKLKVTKGGVFPVSLYRPTEGDSIVRCPFCAKEGSLFGEQFYHPFSIGLSQEQVAHAAWICQTTKDNPCRTCVLKLYPTDDSIEHMPISIREAYAGAIAQSTASQYSGQVKAAQLMENMSKHGILRSRERARGLQRLGENVAVRIDKVERSDGEGTTFYGSGAGIGYGDATYQEKDRTTTLVFPTSEAVKDGVPEPRVNIIAPYNSIIVSGLTVITFLPTIYPKISIKDTRIPLVVYVCVPRGTLAYKAVETLLTIIPDTYIQHLQIVFRIGPEPNQGPGGRILPYVEEGLFRSQYVQLTDQATLVATLRSLHAGYLPIESFNTAGLEKVYRRYSCYNCFRVLRADNNMSCEAKYCEFRGVDLGHSGRVGNSVLLEAMYNMIGVVPGVSRITEGDIVRAKGVNVLKLVSNSRCKLGSALHICENLPVHNYSLSRRGGGTHVDGSTRGQCCNACFETYADALGIEFTSSAKQEDEYYSLTPEAYTLLIAGLTKYSNCPAIIRVSKDPFLNKRMERDRNYDPVPSLLCKALAARGLEMSIFTREMTSFEPLYKRLHPLGQVKVVFYSEGAKYLFSAMGGASPLGAWIREGETPIQALRRNAAIELPGYAVPDLVFAKTGEGADTVYMSRIDGPLPRTSAGWIWVPERPESRGMSKDYLVRENSDLESGLIIAPHVYQQVSESIAEQLLRSGLAVDSKEHMEVQLSGRFRYQITHTYSGPILRPICYSSFHRSMETMVRSFNRRAGITGDASSAARFLQSMVSIYQQVRGVNDMLPTMSMYMQPRIVDGIVLATPYSAVMDRTTSPNILRKHDAYTMNLPSHEYKPISRFMGSILARSGIQSPSDDRIDHMVIIKKEDGKIILQFPTNEVFTIKMNVYGSSMNGVRNTLFARLAMQSMQATGLPSVNMIDVSLQDCIIVTQRRVALWHSSILQATGANHLLVDTSI